MNHPVVSGESLFDMHKMKDGEIQDPKELEKIRKSHNKHKADVRKLKRSIRKCVTDRRAVDQSIRKLNLKFLGHQFDLLNENNTHRGEDFIDFDEDWNDPIPPVTKADKKDGDKKDGEKKDDAAKTGGKAQIGSETEVTCKPKLTASEARWSKIGSAAA